MELLDLNIFLSPLPCACFLIHQVYVLVVVDQIFDGIFGKLEGDLVRKDQIDVHNICLDMKEGGILESLDQRIRMPEKLRFRSPRYNDGAEIPDSTWGRKSLGKAPHVLWSTVEWAFDPIDAFKGRSEPWFNCPIEYHRWG